MSLKDKQSNQNGINVPWYGFLMIFMLYLSPFIMMLPVSLLTGIFRKEDFKLIFGHFVIILLIALVIAIGAVMTLLLRHIIVKFTNTPEGKKIQQQIKAYRYAEYYISYQRYDCSWPFNCSFFKRS